MTGDVWIDVDAEWVNLSAVLRRLLGPREARSAVHAGAPSATSATSATSAGVGQNSPVTPPVDPEGRQG